MRLIGVSLALSLFAAGCNSAPVEPERSIILPILRIQAPASVAPGATFSVGFVFAVDGCTRFVRTESTKNDRVFTFLARGTVSSGQDVICPAIVREAIEVEVIAPPASDPYTIIGKQPDGTETTAQVRIQ